MPFNLGLPFANKYLFGNDVANIYYVSVVYLCQFLVILMHRVPSPTHNFFFSTFTTSNQESEEQLGVALLCK